MNDKETKNLKRKLKRYLKTGKWSQSYYTYWYSVYFPDPNKYKELTEMIWMTP